MKYITFDLKAYVHIHGSQILCLYHKQTVLEDPKI
jgi:hypothetical protein